MPVRNLPSYLSPGQVDALRNHAASVNARLLIALQWRAGLRVSEALDIRRADIDLAGQVITVRRGKGGKTRLVPIHPELHQILHTVLNYTVAGRKSAPLLPVDRSTAWRWVQTAKETAIEAGALDHGVKCGTHTLRHSAARHWLDSGVPLNQIQRWLGHSDLQTTTKTYLPLVPDASGDMERVP